MSVLFDPRIDFGFDEPVFLCESIAWQTEILDPSNYKLMVNAELGGDLTGGE